MSFVDDIPEIRYTENTVNKRENLVACYNKVFA